MLWTVKGFSVHRKTSWADSLILSIIYSYTTRHSCLRALTIKGKIMAAAVDLMSHRTARQKI